MELEHVPGRLPRREYAGQLRLVPEDEHRDVMSANVIDQVTPIYRLRGASSGRREVSSAARSFFTMSSQTQDRGILSKHVKPADEPLTPQAPSPAAPPSECDVLRRKQSLGSYPKAFVQAARFEPSTPGVASIPDPAGTAPFTFPDHHNVPRIGTRPAFRTRGRVSSRGTEGTSRQILALRDECAFEHRFCPEPIFFIRSNGTAVVLPQLICKGGDFAFSWADGCGGFHRFTYRAPFTHHHCCGAWHGSPPSEALWWHDSAPAQG